MIKVITPCSFTKESLSGQFRSSGWLEDNEEIYDWELIQDEFVLHIRKIPNEIASADPEESGG